MKHVHFTKRAVAVLLSSVLLLIFSACSQNGGASSALASSAESSDEPASSSAEIPLPAQSGTSSATTTSAAPTDSNESTDTTSVEYQFAVNNDNTVTITKYTGKGGDIEIPAEIGGKKVTAVGNTFEETGAFQDCTTLTSVIIPNGVTEIQDNAFQGCTRLKTVTIPASVTLLRNCAFDACPNLQSIYFEGDAPEIAHYVLYPPLPTIYYHEGTVGWTNPWYGCSTMTYPTTRQSTGAGNGTVLAAKEGYDAAVSAYEAFLQGDAAVEDPKHDLSESGTVSINDLSLGSDTLYALFDMNGDGIPELHLRPTAGGGYEIFTYRDNQIVLWHANVAYCSPLNDGALLYERPGGAPPHTNYMYITLDTSGNEIASVEFSKYDIVDENGLKVGVRYLYEDNDVSKETWDALTKKFLSIKSDLIKWLSS